ncbi:hypothetical protein [Salinimicrobium sediminilitoris]|uniref:hypothetical protein n=1 Tax=Salinimicrobium sediminilitoris TaxID=2876715 RepID=UPI001E4348C8|nr:hypothetical protein [Salinimicrobium sediminilitoris]MCC8358374.1 hypothetical protein [Salinimicrobium sediminilitoris]
MELTYELRLIDEILKELEFMPENLDEGSIEDTEIFKFILSKINTGSSKISFEKLLAAKSLSCQLFRDDNYGSPEFKEDQISDLLVDRDEREYIELFRYYYHLIPNLEIHTIDGIQLIIGTNFKIEYNLFIALLAQAITSDLNIALEKVRNTLLTSVKPQEWCNLLGAEDCHGYEKERIDLIIHSVIGNYPY